LAKKGTRDKRKALAAERQRRWRRRMKAGLIVLNLQLDARRLDVLVRARAVSEEEADTSHRRGGRARLARAIEQWLDRAG
jgi:hypothetical protein